MSKQTKNNLSPSMEDYLEAIVFLGEKHGVSRVKDISSLINVKRSSVTDALKILANRGLVIHEKYGYITLTPTGAKIAKGIQKKHDLLIRFLVEVLGTHPDIAKKDACRMEHSLSPETFKKLTRFVKSSSWKKERVG